MAIVATIGAAAWGLTRYEVNYDYGNRTTQVETQQKALTQNPCDAEAMVTLANLMVDAGNEDVALQKSLDFLGRCPDAPKLRYVVYDIYQREGQTQKAIEQTDKLIESSPFDPDHWTWRGLRYLDLSAWDRAASDLQQAMVLRPDGEGVPVHLADALASAGKPCAGIPPLRKLLYRHPDSPDRPDLLKKMAQLEANPACGMYRGTGNASFHFVAGDPGILANVTIHGQKGRFLVDSDVSYVGITPEFAAKAGLTEVPGQKWAVETDRGQERLPYLILPEVEADGATAHEVPVLLLPVIERGLDGVLGQDFITRFKVEGHYGDLSLTAI
jgi:tetratricopeptide (TPR) repeat protein